MATKKKYQSLYEEICDYEVLEDTEHEGYRKVVLKTQSGIVDMRIPHHPPEEQAKIDRQITQALFEFAFPDEDWSKVGQLRVIV